MWICNVKQLKYVYSMCDTQITECMKLNVHFLVNSVKIV